MRGATLLETIVALAVLALALAPLANSIVQGWRAEALALNQRRIQEEVARAAAEIADGVTRGGVAVGGLRAAAHVCAAAGAPGPCSGALVFLVPRPANQVVAYRLSGGTLYRSVCTLGQAKCALDRPPAAGGDPVLTGVTAFSAAPSASDPRLIRLVLEAEGGAGRTRAAFRWASEIRPRNVP